MFMPNDVYIWEKKQIRNLWSNPQAIFWIDINDDRALPQIISRSEFEHLLARADLKPIVDPYINVSMTSPIEGSKAEVVQKNAWAAINGVVKSEPEIYQRKTRGLLLSLIFEETKITKQTVYRWLRRYWQFGMCENALSGRYDLCGGLGKPKKFESKRNGRIRIREQFPLKLEDTQAISIENGIKHPSVRGIDQIMSSDFLIDASSGPYRQFAVQVKSLEALADQRTIQKLELERRYWQLKQVPWFIVTENEIDPAIKQNIDWLYPAKTDHTVDSQLFSQIPILLNAFTKAPNTKIIDICKQIDAAYDLTLGQTLSDVRTLTANGFIKFNIYKAFRTITRAIALKIA